MMTISIRMCYEGATVEAIRESERKIKEDLTLFNRFRGQDKYWFIGDGDDRNCLEVFFMGINIDDYLYLRHEFYCGIFANWDEIEVTENK